MDAGFIVPKNFKVNGIVRLFLDKILPEGEVVFLAEIGAYKMGGDSVTKDKIMIGTRFSIGQMYDIIKALQPPAKDAVQHPIEISKNDKSVWISKTFCILANDRAGQYQLVDTAEVISDFFLFVAGQAEDKFVAGGPMAGALRRFFSCVQMGSIHVALNESKAFKKSIPAIFKIIFSMPVKEGSIFFKLLDEAIKKQIFVNDEGVERYNKTAMVDEDGYVI